MSFVAGCLFSRGLLTPDEPFPEVVLCWSSWPCLSVCSTTLNVAIGTRHSPPNERLLLVRGAQRGSLVFVGTSRLHCGHCRPVQFGKCFGRAKVKVSRGVNQPLLHGTCSSVAPCTSRMVCNGCVCKCDGEPSILPTELHTNSPRGLCGAVVLMCWRVWRLHGST